MFEGACDQIGDCLSAVKHKMTSDMQHILSSDFTADEIKAVLFQMGPTKALGPDVRLLWSMRFCRLMPVHLANV